MSDNTTVRRPLSHGPYWTNYGLETDIFQITSIAFDCDPSRNKFSNLKVTVGLELKEPLTFYSDPNRNPYAWVILNGDLVQRSRFNVFKKINDARGAMPNTVPIPKGRYTIVWEIDAKIMAYLRIKRIDLTPQSQIILFGRHGQSAEAKEIFKFQIHLNSLDTARLPLCQGLYWTNWKSGLDTSAFQITSVKFDHNPPLAAKLSELNVTIGLDVNETLTQINDSKSDPYAWVILDGDPLKLSNFNILKKINEVRGVRPTTEPIPRGHYTISWGIGIVVMAALRAKGIKITAESEIIVAGRSEKLADAKEIFRIQLHLS